MPEFEPPEPEKGNFYGVKAIGSIFKYIDFPISKQEIIQRYGDREIEYTTGETIKVRDILTDSQLDKFNSLADLEQAFHEKLSSE